MYTLGIDLGTTFTAAAVWRGGRVEICSLGTRAAAIPSVVLAREDGSFLTGEAAARRAVVEPGRVAREFKRRFGDSTPVLLGGRPFTAQALTAQLLASVVAAVSAREGGAPAGVCVSHPANWGSFKTDLMREAVQLANLRVPVSFTTEPEAAAVSYTQQERLAEGASVAVYDLGGGTFDAAVLRRTGKGFEVLGQPEGIERLGGIDIDAAVFAHVARAVGAPLTELDEDDPAAVSAVARLRAECTEAKEALSADTDVTIPVLLPTVSTEVRLTRSELEEMIRPSLYDSIESLRRAVRSAGLEPADLAAVLLVGGSSRMPLVAQLVAGEMGRPVAVDAHPKHAIAMGAAWLSSGTALRTAPADATPAAEPAPVSEPVDQVGPAAPVEPEVVPARFEPAAARLSASQAEPAPVNPWPARSAPVPTPATVSPAEPLMYGSVMGASVGLAAVAGAEAGIASAATPPLAGPAPVQPPAALRGGGPSGHGAEVSRVDEASQLAHHQQPVHQHKPTGHQQTHQSTAHHQGHKGHQQHQQHQGHQGHQQGVHEGHPQGVHDQQYALQNHQLPHPPQGQDFARLDLQNAYISPAPSGVPAPALGSRNPSVIRGRQLAIGAGIGAAALVVVLAGYLATHRNEPRIAMTTPAADGSTVPSAPATVASTVAADSTAASSGAGQNVAPVGNRPPAQLVISVQVTGRGGSVRSSDGRISCPGNCTATYSAGRRVTLTASGPGFLGWASCSQPTGLSCTIGGSGRFSPVARFANTVPTTTTTTTTSPTTTSSTTTSSTTTSSTTTTTTSSTTTPPPPAGAGGNPGGVGVPPAQGGQGGSTTSSPPVIG